MIKDLYYIYQHVDPDTGEIVYVGLGTGSRAWATGTSSGSHRGNMHSAWLSELYHQGYTMGDIVQITATLLSKKYATALENESIKKLKPRFNIQGNPDVFLNKEFTEGEALDAYEDRQKGMPYHLIAKKYNKESSNYSVLGMRMVKAGENIINRKNKE